LRLFSRCIFQLLFSATRAWRAEANAASQPPVPLLSPNFFTNKGESHFPAIAHAVSIEKKVLGGVVPWIIYRAFVVGGDYLFLWGQLLMDLTSLTSAHVLVLFVCIGALLSGVRGLYEKNPQPSGGGRCYHPHLQAFGHALVQGNSRTGRDPRELSVS